MPSAFSLRHTSSCATVAVVLQFLHPFDFFFVTFLPNVAVSNIAIEMLFW